MKDIRTINQNVHNLESIGTTLYFGLKLMPKCKSWLQLRVSLYPLVCLLHIHSVSKNYAQKHII